MGRILSEKRKDRIADALIRVGGILVILVVAAIVINIGMQALPLFLPARATEPAVVAQIRTPFAVGSDARRETPWTLDADGVVRFPGAPDTAPIVVVDGELVAADHEIHDLLSVLSADGELVVGTIRFRDQWQGQQRRSSASWRAAADPLRLAGSAPTTDGSDAPPVLRWTGVTANADSDGNLLAAAWTDDGRVLFATWDVEDEEWEMASPPTALDARRVVVSAELEQVAVLTGGGAIRLFRWPSFEELEVVGVDVPVASLRYLIGGGTLVLGHTDGAVSVLLTVPRVRVANLGSRSLEVAGGRISPGEESIVPDDEVGRRFASRSDVELRSAPPLGRVIRHLPAMDGRPVSIAPSHRRRVFLVAAESGQLALYHSTSARRLLRLQLGEQPPGPVAIDPKGDGVTAACGGRLLTAAVDNPHPEVSLRTLFLPTWYEGYAAPKWVWQSTGGTDAFEPKMSLWPLIFGTLKATVYALLFSVPLALMAAVYVSQLAPRWLQSLIKPALELMAAVPSVVVGFLAALWLAPRLEAALFPSLLGVASLPLAVVLALLLWRLVPWHWRQKAPDGTELLVLALSVTATLVLASQVAGPLERWLFDGDLQRFLFTEWGIRYDQRNSLVVGLALGFAVIPVIFTIAEDACSAVPRSLVAASRALGANRWQTALRLVVPAASPGLFAAVMLGLGRAVGETMIVLMAAGNTPVLDLSAFNGMRTMSAAIAVEIPEAPVGGTLFRVLFLTGILLFAFTFALTTLADMVGSFLRRRYARF